MIAFFCRTPYHIFRMLQIKMELYPNEVAEAYIFDSFPKADNITSRLTISGIFKQVFYVRDAENFKTGHLSALRSIIGDSYLNKIMEGKIFSEIFFFNVFAQSNDVAINNAKRANRSCIVNMVEDGPTLYNIFKKDGITQNFIYPILGLWSPSKCVDYWWFSEPEMMHPFGNGKKKQLPKVNKNKRELLRVINDVFGYKDNLIIKNADILFMEECYWSDGLLKTNDDFDLFMKIKQHYPEMNTCVKIHPRTKVNRFKEQFDVIEADGIPWEVYALNLDLENKILVSMLCGTMTSTKFLFGEETFSLLLYPMFIDKVREVKTNKVYFTKQRREQAKNQVKLYDDKTKFVIVDSLDEAFKTIDKWIERLGRKNSV